MTIDATFWVMISFFAFIGLLVYFKIPQKIKTVLDSKNKYSIQQIPLVLSWAITTHKSQGLSIEKALIDIGSSIFEYGQTYVALSRVKSLEGLYLTKVNPSKIKAHPRVVEFYKQFKKQINS